MYTENEKQASEIIAWEIGSCILYKNIIVRDLASDPSACLFQTGNCHLRWSQKLLFWTILRHFGHFRQFWTGTTVKQKWAISKS